jgi:Icc-related predicted phosphoesterase
VKLIALSDLHLEHEQRRAYASLVAQDVCLRNASVLLIGGDIGETREQLCAGLRMFSRFPGRRLMYLGNNDLQTTHSLLTTGYDELSQLVEDHGFELLDANPVVIGNVGFVGNCGWYDGSLFETHDYKPKIEKSLVQQESAVRFQKLQIQCTEQEFLDHCIARMTMHIDSIRKERVVLGIHHVPSSDFVLYGASDNYDLRNYWMGSTRLAKLYQHPSIVLGLTGHTHRSDHHLVGKQIVYNISSSTHAPWQVFDI